MRVCELVCTDGRKSFYGKAYVEIDQEGNETLFSYGTPIIKRAANGQLTRLWAGYSATTGRHIRAFCDLTKNEFTNMKVEKMEG